MAIGAKLVSPPLFQSMYSRSRYSCSGIVERQVARAAPRRARASASSRGCGVSSGISTDQCSLVGPERGRRGADGGRRHAPSVGTAPRRTGVRAHPSYGFAAGSRPSEHPWISWTSWGSTGSRAIPRRPVTWWRRFDGPRRSAWASVFVSERFNTKDACAFSGAAGAVSTTLGVATAATNHNTRHLLVTATFATTMHRLTDGRFTLGFGRGFDMLFDVIGAPRVTMAQLEDVDRVAAPALARRGDPRSRRSRRPVPLPESGPLVRRGHPDPAHRARRAHPRVRRTRRRRGGAPHVLHRRDARPQRRSRASGCRPRPVGTRRACGCGRCSRPWATTSTRSCG